MISGFCYSKSKYEERRAVMAYNLMKLAILRGELNRAEIMDMLDAYMVFKRITVDEYRELAALAGEEE